MDLCSQQGKERVGPAERVALEHIHCGFSGSTETSTLPCVKEKLTGRCSIAQGVQLGILWWPNRVGWGFGKRETQKGRECIHIHVAVRQKLTQHCKALSLNLKKWKKEEERKIHSRSSAHIFSSSFWRSLSSTPAPPCSRADFQRHVCLLTYLQLNWGHEDGKGGQMAAAAYSSSSVRKGHVAPFIRPDQLIPVDTKRLFAFPYHLERKLLFMRHFHLKSDAFHTCMHTHTCMCAYTQWNTIQP